MSKKKVLLLMEVLNVKSYSFLPSAQPFDPSFILSSTACNVICSILFKERFQYHDEKFLFLMDLLNTNFRLINTPWIQVRLRRHLHSQWTD